eukprot:scaffold56359_cov66-Phaeocystis_antarctica.AAC.2
MPPCAPRRNGGASLITAGPHALRRRCRVRGAGSRLVPRAREARGRSSGPQLPSKCCPCPLSLRSS